jgi:hypothetical protein
MSSGYRGLTVRTVRTSSHERNTKDHANDRQRIPVAFGAVGLAVVEDFAPRIAVAHHTGSEGH